MTGEPSPNLKTMSIYSNWAKSTIRYSDLDPNGHVNNGAINAFFEDGRVRFRNDRMLKLGDEILTGFALVKFTAEYLAPLYFPGSVDVGTVVTRIGRSSFSLGQGIFSDGTCVATAEVITVSFDPKSKHSKKLTPELRTILEDSSRKV